MPVRRAASGRPTADADSAPRGLEVHQVEHPGELLLLLCPAAPLHAPRKPRSPRPCGAGTAEVLKHHADVARMQRRHHVTSRSWIKTWPWSGASSPRPRATACLASSGPRSAKNSCWSTERSMPRIASVCRSAWRICRTAGTGARSNGRRRRGHHQPGSGGFDLGPDALPSPARTARRTDRAPGSRWSRSGTASRRSARDQVAHIDAGRPADLGRHRHHAVLGQAEVDPLVRHLELLAAGRAGVMHQVSTQPSPLPWA